MKALHFGNCADWGSSSGSLAKLTAMRRASSRVSSLAARAPTGQHQRLGDSRPGYWFHDGHNTDHIDDVKLGSGFASPRTAYFEAGYAVNRHQSTAAVRGMIGIMTRKSASTPKLASVPKSASIPKLTDAERHNPDDPAQYKRFVEAARKAEADESREGSDRAFNRIGIKKVTPLRKRRG